MRLGLAHGTLVAASNGAQGRLVGVDFQAWPDRVVGGALDTVHRLEGTAHDGDETPLTCSPSPPITRSNRANASNIRTDVQDGPMMLCSLAHGADMVAAVKGAQRRFVGVDVLARPDRVVGGGARCSGLGWKGHTHTGGATGMNLLADGAENRGAFMMRKRG